jgi:hypothetical protein
MFLNHKLVDILPGTAHGKKYELFFHVALEKSLRETHHLSPMNKIKKNLKSGTY